MYFYKTVSETVLSPDSISVDCLHEGVWSATVTLDEESEEHHSFTHTPKHTDAQATESTVFSMGNGDSSTMSLNTDHARAQTSISSALPLGYKPSTYHARAQKMMSSALPLGHKPSIAMMHCCCCCHCVVYNCVPASVVEKSKPIISQVRRL